MNKLEVAIVLGVMLFVLGLLYEHHFVDVARAENALEYCEGLGYKSYLGYRGYAFDETPVAVRCTHPQQDVSIKTESTKEHREGYL